jgi:hypothetical protein
MGSVIFMDISELQQSHQPVESHFIQWSKWAAAQGPYYTFF